MLYDVRLELHYDYDASVHGDRHLVRVSPISIPGVQRVIASSLSFLGLGVQPPTPDLGSMVAEGAKYLPDSWWLTVFPGLAILIAVFGFNLIGDALREILGVDQ